MKPGLRALVDDTAPATVAENAHGDVRMTPLGALQTNLRAADGTELSFAGYVVTDNGTEFAVAASGTSQSFRSVNALRSNIVGFNMDTAETMYIRFSSGAASIASGGFTIKVAPLSELILRDPIWTGAMTVIWSGTPTGYFTGMELLVDP